MGYFVVLVAYLTNHYAYIMIIKAKQTIKLEHPWQFYDKC